MNNFSKNRLLGLLICLILILSGCEKLTRRDLLGTYTGTYHYYKYAPGQTTIDEWGDDAVIITKWGRHGVDLNGYEILTDSITDDGYTTFLSPNQTGGNYVHFKEDSLHFYELLEAKFGYFSYREHWLKKE